VNSALANNTPTLIIDLDRVTGNTPRGAVRMQAATPAATPA